MAGKVDVKPETILSSSANFDFDRDFRLQTLSSKHSGAQKVQINGGKRRLNCSIYVSRHLFEIFAEPENILLTRDGVIKLEFDNIISRIFSVFSELYPV